MTVFAELETDTPGTVEGLTKTKNGNGFKTHIILFNAYLKLL